MSADSVVLVAVVRVEIEDKEQVATLKHNQLV